VQTKKLPGSPAPCYLDRPQKETGRFEGGPFGARSVLSDDLRRRGTDLFELLDEGLALFKKAGFFFAGRGVAAEHFFHAR
jgi:hypothetical protein